MFNAFTIFTCLSSVVLVLAIFIAFLICLLKCKKAGDFRRKPKVDINDTYGTYGISGTTSDNTTVEDTTAGPGGCD